MGVSVCVILYFAKLRNDYLKTKTPCLKLLKLIEYNHKTETEQDIEEAKEEIDALKKRIIDKFSDHNESD